MRHATAHFFDDFLGLQVITATATQLNTPWGSVIVGTTPTIKGLTSEATGAVQLLLTSTSEAQIACLHWGDLLALKLGNLRQFAFRMKASAITTNESVVAGIGSAYNATEDSVAINAWFKLAATTDILVETDDGATDDDDNDSGVDIVAATYKEYLIDFRQGLADVRFYVGDSNVRMKRVPGGPFTLAGAAAATYVQPFFMLHKASGSTTPNATLDYVDIEYIR
jgi:hypothetical protein